MTTKCETSVHWLVRKDLPYVVAIDAKACRSPWSEFDYLEALRIRNVIGMVAERENRVVGSMCYELHKHRLQIIRFCVHPNSQRCGVGTDMVRRLKCKLSEARRHTIVVELHEDELAAQCFFRSQGFKAVAVEREYFVDCGDCYVMQYSLCEPEPHWTNRLTAFDGRGAEC